MDEENSTTTVTESFKKLDELVAYHLNRLLNDVGKFELLLISIAIVSALYRIFLPTISEDLDPLFQMFFPSFSLKPFAVISVISLGATMLFFTLLVLRIVGSSLIKFVQFLWFTLLWVNNSLWKLPLKILYLIGFKSQAEKLNKLLYSLKSEVYSKELWVAESPLEGRRLNVPLDPAKFLYAKCEVQVKQVSENHWRTGLVFEGPERQEYIFHVYEDFNEPGVLKTRIVLRMPGQEVTDKKDVLTGIKDIRDLQLEVQNTNDKVTFLVNGRTINFFEVPLENITNLYFAAWADDRPFTIEFRNIEVLS